VANRRCHLYAGSDRTFFIMGAEWPEAAAFGPIGIIVRREARFIIIPEGAGRARRANKGIGGRISKRSERNIGSPMVIVGAIIERNGNAELLAPRDAMATLTLSRLFSPLSIFSLSTLFLPVRLILDTSVACPRACLRVCVSACRRGCATTREDGREGRGGLPR
jgi:hypothetical protein